MIEAVLKRTTNVGTFNLAAKSDLASLKAEAYRWSKNCSYLSNVADNDVVKKAVW